MMAMREQLESHMIKGHRFGFATTPDPGQLLSSASFMSTSDQ
ncbi:unnamed protein product [Brassica rapa subsp. trilocularis]